MSIHVLCFYKSQFITNVSSEINLLWSHLNHTICFPNGLRKSFCIHTHVNIKGKFDPSLTKHTILRHAVEWKYIPNSFKLGTSQTWVVSLTSMSLYPQKEPHFIFQQEEHNPRAWLSALEEGKVRCSCRKSKPDIRYYKQDTSYNRKFSFDLSRHKLLAT